MKKLVMGDGLNASKEQEIDYFSQIPLELFVNIAKYLDPESIRSFMFTNRQLCRYGFNEMVWKRFFLGLTLQKGMTYRQVVLGYNSKRLRLDKLLNDNVYLKSNIKALGEFAYSPVVASKAMSISKAYYQHFSESVRLQASLVRNIIVNKIELWYLIPEVLRTRELFLAACRAFKSEEQLGIALDVNILRLTPKEHESFFSDKEIVLSCIEKNILGGPNLAVISEGLKKDAEFVKQAIKSGGVAIYRHASLTVKRNSEVRAMVQDISPWLLSRRW